MPFDPQRAEIRFGCGLSPDLGGAGDVATLLARLTGPDRAAQEWPIDGFDQFQSRLEQQYALRRLQKDKRGTAEAREAEAQEKALRRESARAQRLWFGHSLMRRVTGFDGFRERLTAFWADHFTVRGKVGVMRRGAAAYVEQSIRPHVAGRFSDMLRAVAVAPMMLHYLDQGQSVGPNSPAGRRRSGRGLNENLAREMLELHTLGVAGGYDQADVRGFAELLTGLSYRPNTGFRFRPNWAEPGGETLLGVTYGGDGPARLEDIFAALEDLARHPDTAQHLAQKIAVHFVGDAPDPAMVQDMAAAYRASDGALLPLYQAMLEHPAAWDGPGNVKPPMDFVASSLRALGVREVPLRNQRQMEMLYHNPLALMGQPWEEPAGPDGWPEEDSAWITPQRLAGRLQWAMNVPQVVAKPLPDPRRFVHTALGELAGDTVVQAAARAETRAQGIGVILASPDFQRM